jgi:predicted transposase/invertase (TIGR01784 family)
VLAREKEVCQEILRTLLSDEKLEVREVTEQKFITSSGREVILDALCKLGNGKLVNIEVQKGKDNDDIRRCRFHLAAITTYSTLKSMKFQDVPDVEILYITEYDLLKNNQTVTVSTMCQCVEGQYIPVNDGAKIYYANTKVDDGTDKSELLHLFLEREPFSNSKFPKLSEKVAYFKSTPKGSEEMCDIVAEFAKENFEAGKEEGAKLHAQKAAKKMIAQGFSNKDISELIFLPVEEVEQLRSL